MMFFGKWFNTDEVDAFARALARDISGRLPPPAHGGAKKITPERINSAREAMRERAVAFTKKNQMNWFKKAHLTNTFKWELREAGYDSTFVDTWTYDLALFLSAGKAKP
jgi:hypothetical protein